MKFYKNKNKITIFSGILFLSLIILSNNNGNNNMLTDNPSKTIIEDIPEDYNKILLPKSSYWNNSMDPIFIDDTTPYEGGSITWATAETKSWCTGSGTFNNPYLIENLTINGQTSGSCIRIKDSNVYFRIRNCTVYNSGSVNDVDAGIKYENVNNSQIIGNNCSFNGENGIMLYPNCNNNTISNNTLSHNTDRGVELRDDCHNNMISKNNVSFNGGFGIYVRIDSTNNTIFNNNAFNCSYGIQLSGADFNNISHNNIYNNTNEGIRIYTCINNTVTFNIISNHVGSGINGLHITQYSHNNSVSNNTAVNNNIGITIDSNSEDNELNNNTARYNIHGFLVSSNSDNNIITENLAKNNTGSGLRVSLSSDRNTISYNSFENNSNDGIQLQNDCNDNVIIGNKILFNIDNGIELIGTDNDGTRVLGNLLLDNNNPYVVGGGTNNDESLNNKAGLFSPGSIDDNGDDGDGGGNFTWAEFSKTPLCSGFGTWSNPYLINEFTIDASGSGSGLFIRDSFVPFIISNSTIYNSGSVNDVDAGIKFKNVNNSQIIGNNCSFNGENGIMLYPNCNNNTISNNILSHNTDRGVELRIDCHNNMISNNNVSFNGGYGIYVRINSTNNTIFNNNAFNCSYGIQLSGADFNNVSHNHIFNNSNDGIRVYTCVNNTFTNNVFMDQTSTDKCGLLITEHSHNNTVFNNTALNNIIGIGVSAYSDENRIINNTAYFNTHGLLFYFYADRNLCSGNTAENNSLQGIRISWGSEYNTIINNVASNNTDDGIQLYSNSKYNRIIGNTISSNVDNGIEIYDNCNYNNITGNSIFDNRDDGIYCHISCLHNNISNNEIMDNGNDGIRFSSSCLSNTIKENKIQNNAQYGAEIENSDCNYNRFFNNTFKNNGNHARDKGSNFWDNGTLGNYWDDYTGKDIDDNGIGEDPYTTIIDSAGSQDNKPIWWDAPAISISFPHTNDIFGQAPPNYTISIDEGIPHTRWYQLWNGTVKTPNTTFIYLTNTNISKANWDLIGNGSLILSFYVNDSRGYIGFYNISIKKDLNRPIINIYKPEPYSASANTPLNYTIIKDGVNLNVTWYCIYNSSYTSENITFTGTNGTLNAGIWAFLENGTYTLRMYINNTAGTKNFNEVKIIKDIFNPNITFISPAVGSFYANTPPTLVLSIDEGNLDSTWYKITNASGSFGNYTYEGDITQTVWNLVGHGWVNLTFWANDTAGNVYQFGFNLTVIKDLIVPVVSITTPPMGYKYGSVSPIYAISITETYLYKYWYTISSGAGNHYITAITGSIDQTLWDTFANGQYTINFYAQDMAGNIGFAYVIIIKEVVASPPTTTTEDDFLGQLLLRGILIPVIGAVVGIGIKVVFSRSKKKKEGMFGLIKGFSKIENKEVFLRENLGKVDWEGFKETWELYENRQITQKDLLKEGKNQFGKKFTNMFLKKSKK